MQSYTSFIAENGGSIVDFPRHVTADMIGEYPLLTSLSDVNVAAPPANFIPSLTHCLTCRRPLSSSPAHERVTTQVAARLRDKLNIDIQPASAFLCGGCHRALYRDGPFIRPVYAVDSSKRTSQKRSALSIPPPDEHSAIMANMINRSRSNPLSPLSPSFAHVKPQRNRLPLRSSDGRRRMSLSGSLLREAAAPSPEPTPYPSPTPSLATDGEQSSVVTDSKPRRSQRNALPVDIPPPPPSSRTGERYQAVIEEESNLSSDGRTQYSFETDIDMSGVLVFSAARIADPIKFDRYLRQAEVLSSYTSEPYNENQALHLLLENDYDIDKCLAVLDNVFNHHYFQVSLSYDAADETHQQRFPLQLTNVDVCSICRQLTGHRPLIKQHRFMSDDHMQMDFDEEKSFSPHQNLLFPSVKLESSIPNDLNTTMITTLTEMNGIYDSESKTNDSHQQTSTEVFSTRKPSVIEALSCSHDSCTRTYHLDCLQFPEDIIVPTSKRWFCVAHFCQVCGCYVHGNTGIQHLTKKTHHNNARSSPSCITCYRSYCRRHRQTAGFNTHRQCSVCQKERSTVDYEERLQFIEAIDGIIHGTIPVQSADVDMLVGALECAGGIDVLMRNGDQWRSFDKTYGIMETVRESQRMQLNLEQ